MTGKQLKIQGKGSVYEAFCETVVGCMASMIPVPREHDFGVDYYCLPRQGLDRHAETVVHLCGIQVKGGSAPSLRFGGIDTNSGKWRDYELNWLRALPVPLFLAWVDPGFQRVDLYSVSTVLAVFWEAGMPFQIDCTLRPPEYASPVDTRAPSSEPAPSTSTGGDGRIWTVDLGAPFLSLTLTDLSQADIAADRCRILVHWLTNDRWSVMNLCSGIPRFKVIQSYLTNQLPTVEEHRMFWHARTGNEISKMAEVLVPGIATIARHLITVRKYEEASMWRGPLQWCLNQGWLESFGRDVIAELDEKHGGGPTSA